MNIVRGLALIILAGTPLLGLGAAAQSPPAEQGLRIHAQVLPVPSEVLFPKAVEALLDHHCIILAVNQQLGILSFRTQSEDRTARYRKHLNVLEGTLLFKRESPASTRVRATLTLGWQETDQKVFTTGVQQDADAGYYKWLFDLLGKTPPSSSR